MWHENLLGLDENCPFLSRILREDVKPCLFFENKKVNYILFWIKKQKKKFLINLSLYFIYLFFKFFDKILTAVKTNALEIEPVLFDNNVLMPPIR